MSPQAVLDRKTRKKTSSGGDDSEGIIDEFFAVTMTSVYLVSSQKDSDNTPIVEKIALNGESSISTGERLHNGNLVGIMRSGIVLYIEDYSPFSGRGKRPQRPEEVNIAYWGGHTSPIVALCLDRDDALICLHSKELKICDSRWRKETEETLSHIGDNHPVFILSATEAIRFD